MPNPDELAVMNSLRQLLGPLIKAMGAATVGMLDEAIVAGYQQARPGPVSTVERLRLWSEIGQPILDKHLAKIRGLVP